MENTNLQFAVEGARKTLLAACVGSKPASPSNAIRSVCERTLTDMLLAEQNLPRAAAAFLRMLAELAQELRLEPMEALTAAMQGIADLRRVLPPARLDEVRQAIELEFLGAGEVLASILKAETAEHR